MKLSIELAAVKDVDKLEQLYYELNDYLEKNMNYPGWKKGIYPVRQNAVDGVKDNHLYIARYNGKIVGTMIINHKPEPAYYNVNWAIESDYSDIYVIHTFAVHPEYLKCGTGKKMLDFAFRQGIEEHVKAIRLDVYEKNAPAIYLYEKCGYKYIETVNLGLQAYGLEWFRLYEIILNEKNR